MREKYTLQCTNNFEAIVRRQFSKVYYEGKVYKLLQRRTMMRGDWPLVTPQHTLNSFQNDDQGSEIYQVRSFWMIII